jgi:hypothetical protein
MFNRVLFVIAGLYDGLLGLAFLLFGPRLFAYYQVTPPNHYGYIHFPALLLILFGAMFFRIASDPVRYRDLIPMGIGLKAAYAGTVFYYALNGGLPQMWMPFAWADTGFLLLFVVSWMGLRGGRR